MRKPLVLFSVAALFFSTVTASAQTEPPPPAIDTIVSTYGENANKQEAAQFSEIGQTASVQVQKLPDGKVEELKRSDDYWYANLELKKEEPTATVQPKERRSLVDQTWFQNLLWILILCTFIGVVVWYLASSNVSLFRKTPKKILEEEPAGELSDDIFSIDYETEIGKAVADKAYRLAVRLWYLKTLKEMADRNLIAYRHEKSNGDYVTALYGGPYYRSFFRLTRNFEYTWYGQFPISAEAYDMMQADFAHFKNSLS